MLKLIFRLLVVLLAAASPLAAQIPTVPGVASPAWQPDPEISAEIASNPDIVRIKLLAAMNALLNTPKKLEIEMSATASDSPSLGRYSRIRIQTEDGTIDGMTLNKADVEFHDVQLNTTKLIREEKIDTVNVKDINMDVIVREVDLNSFLAAKSKKINVDDPKVEMLPGKINLSGSTKYSFMKVKFWATGVFAVNEGRSIWFHPKKLKVNGLGMPRAFVGTIVKRINPVLNLEKFPFRLNLREIRIEAGSLRFTSGREGN